MKKILTGAHGQPVAEAELHPVHNVYNGLFNSVSGLKIDLKNPTPAMINITDISHSLGKMCRFGCHANRFYTVAQHSVIVARMAPKHLAKAGLIHDFSEAYLGDVIKPLKVMLGEVYEGLESTFMNVICEKYGVDPEDLKAIKVYDKELLEIEHHCFQLGNLEPFLEIHARLFDRNVPIFWEVLDSTFYLQREFIELFGKGACDGM